jgi:DNA-binding XRE family transcriptional regulator
MSPAEKLAKAKARSATPTRVVRRIWKCNLREMRLALNLSQRDVAASVGLSCAGYHQIETCGNDVCLSTCVKLSEFFAKPILEIWEKPESEDTR